MSTENLQIDDHAELETYLDATGWLMGRGMTSRTLDGGVSCRTVLVRFTDGQAWVLKQALPELRTESDWHCDPARIHLEAKGLHELEKLVPKDHLARFVFLDETRHVFAMEAVPEPHRNWKQMLMEGRPRPRHVRQFGELLGTIHRESAVHAAELASAFDERQFFEALRLEPYYRFTARRHLETEAFYQTLIEDCLSTRQTLVHGDYSPKNILIANGKLVLLDHEVIHWGDPAFDIGFALTHLLSKSHVLVDHRKDFIAAARQFWQQYRETVGEALWADDAFSARAARHTLGCLLARVSGRSTLEYMSKSKRRQQRQLVIPMMDAPPETVEGLIDRWKRSLNS